MTCVPHQRRAPRSKLKLAVGGAIATAAVGLLAGAGSAPASSGGIAIGGEGTTPPPSGVTTPGTQAKLKNGFAIAPADAPRRVQRAIEAANEIVKGKPYCLGGGHQRRRDRCYDCSGTVSYALTGAGLLDFAMPSGSFMRWEARGRGRWITTYASSGHIYAVIAGLRLDTSMTTGEGPGWSDVMRSSKGFVARHPTGL